MRKNGFALVLLAAGALAVVGCSERAQQRTRDRWRDLTGKDEPSQRATVDLNSASQQQLSKLPGLTDDDAARIIANRPYGSKRGLLRKNVIGQGKYDKIESYVYVTPPAGHRHGNEED